MDARILYCVLGWTEGDRGAGSAFEWALAAFDMQWPRGEGQLRVLSFEDICAGIQILANIWFTNYHVNFSPEPVQLELHLSEVETESVR